MLIDGSLLKPVEISTSPRIADQAQPPQEEVENLTLSEETITSPAVKNNPPSRDLKGIAKSLSVWGVVKLVQKIIYGCSLGAFFFCTTAGNLLINEAGSPLKANTNNLLPSNNTPLNVESFFKDAPDYDLLLQTLRENEIDMEKFFGPDDRFLNSPEQINRLIELLKQKDSLVNPSPKIDKAISCLSTYKEIYIKTFGVKELEYEDLLNSKKLNTGIKSLLESHRENVTDQQVTYFRALIKRSVKLHSFNQYKNKDGSIKVKDITYKILFPDSSERFVTVNIPEKPNNDSDQEPLIYDIANSISDMNFKATSEINMFQKDFNNYVMIHTGALSNSELEEIGELANKKVIPVVIFSRKETISNFFNKIRKLEIPTGKTGSADIEFLSYDKEKNTLVTQNLNGRGTIYTNPNIFREEVPVIIVPKEHINLINWQTALISSGALLLSLGARFGGNPLVRRRITSYRSATERIQDIILRPVLKIVRKTSQGFSSRPKETENSLIQ